METTEIICKNKKSDSITLTKVTKNSRKKYQEVLTEVSNIGSGAVQASFPILGDKFTVDKIRKMAPNGVFTTSIDKNMLSKFKDGTFSTMVRDENNHLVKNAGFKEINIESGLNLTEVLAMGMQACAFISGQYYMTQINSRLDMMDKKIDKLLKIEKNKSISVLKAVRERLGELIEQEYVDTTDLNELAILRNEVNKVYFDYDGRMNDDYEEVTEFSSGKWLVEERVDEFTEKIDELNFDMSICAEADKLRLQTTMVEIAVRLKLNVNDPKITQLLKKLKKDYDDSFIKQMNDYPDEIMNMIIENGECIVGTGKDFGLIDRDRDELMYIITERAGAMIEDRNTIRECSLIEKVLEESKKKMEVLLAVDEEGKQRMFVPVLT